MRKAGLALLVLSVAIVTATTWSSASEKKSSPVVGESAPDVKLSDQNGKVFVLADTLREREFVVLAFYPKAFTSG